MARKRKGGIPKIRLPFKIPQTLFLPLTFIIGAWVGHSTLPSQSVELPLGTSSVKACFTPGENCETFIISAIGKAQNEILVQSYAFTSQPIADALLSAKNRGARVSILYDRKAAKDHRSQIPKLQDLGITTLADQVKGISHNKVMVIDKSTVISGSYNWTNAARDRNSENVFIVHNPELAQLYATQWHKLSKREVSLPK
jgi:phospholipase D